MTDTVRLRATATFEYDARPEHYPDADPKRMAEIDLGNFQDMFAFGECYAIGDNASVTVEPVEPLNADLIDRWDRLKDELPTDHARAAELLFDLGDEMADFIERRLTRPATEVAGQSETPVHDWFGLTYAAYLVVPRLALQHMPVEWQQRFVALLNELNETVPTPNSYTVARDDADPDPWADYRHGDALKLLGRTC